MPSNVVPFQPSQQMYPPPYMSPGYYPGCGCGCPPYCNYPPPPAPSPAPIQAPIIGVTDGSRAAPGIVGEYIRSQIDIPITAGTVNNSVVSPLVVQPGDWNLWASMWFSVLVGPVSFILSPPPTGTSNAMGAWAGSIASAGTGSVLEAIILNGQMTAASFSVPSVLPFNVRIDQSLGSLTAGTATFLVEGRRMR